MYHKRCTARNGHELKSDVSHVESSEHLVNVESSVCHVMHVPLQWSLGQVYADCPFALLNNSSLKDGT